jgi:hypothetical protein
MSIPAVVTKCDLAIDAVTALLFSEEAPLTNDPARCDDRRAVWAHIPPTFPKREVFVHFHGHNAYVKVNSAGKSALSDWVLGHRRSQASGTDATGIKYKLAAMTNAKHQPLVLAAENGIPVPSYVVGEKVAAGKTVFDAQPATEANFNAAIAFRDARIAANAAAKLADPAKKDKDLPPVPGNPKEFWSYEDPGKFKNSDGFEKLIGNCIEHLVLLTKPAAAGGTTYMDRTALIDTTTQSFDVNKIDHLFVSGHSGGGGPLAAVTLSALTMRIPTSLWYLDAAYSEHGVKECRQFCENWKTKSKLGMKNDESRLVLIDFDTKVGTKKIIDELKKAPAFTVTEITHDNSGESARKPAEAAAKAAGKTPAEIKAAGQTAVDAELAKRLADVQKAMATEPILAIHTSVGHDSIPAFYLPILLEHNGA